MLHRSNGLNTINVTTTTANNSSINNTTSPNMMSMALSSREPQRFSTPGFDCFAVKFSIQGELACASSMNFGMKGAGRVWIFNPQSSKMDRMTSLGNQAHSHYDTVDGIFDTSWNYHRPGLLVTAMADGSVGLIDNKMNRATILAKEHRKEASSVDFNPMISEKLLSTSFDGTIKIWSIHEKCSMSTLSGHTGIVYQGVWSPKDMTALISAGSDRSIRLWDDRQASRPVKTINNAHDNEVLSVDWNRSNNLQFVSGSSDQTIRVWDWRHVERPLHLLRGHQRTVRKVRWSPIDQNVIFSVGYDMSLRVWNPNCLNPIAGSWEGHCEFVMGVDQSLVTGLVATCAWDQSIYLTNPMHWGQVFR